MSIVFLIPVVFLCFCLFKDCVYHGDPFDVALERSLPEVLYPCLLLLFTTTVCAVLQLGTEVYQVVFFAAYVLLIFLVENEVCIVLIHDSMYALN